MGSPDRAYRKRQSIRCRYEAPARAGSVLAGRDASHATSAPNAFDRRMVSHARCDVSRRFFTHRT